MIKTIYRYFSFPNRLAILNGFLITIITGLNVYFQAFCVPTTWAIAVLAVCFINTIVYPIFEKSNIAPAISFINGISLFVFIYCVIFLAEMNLAGLLLSVVGVGLFTYIPHFFVIQLVYRNLIHPAVKKSRKYFLAAVIICFGAVIYTDQEYKKAINSVENFKRSNYTELERSFMFSIESIDFCVLVI